MHVILLNGLLWLFTIYRETNSSTICANDKQKCLTNYTTTTIYVMFLVNKELSLFPNLESILYIFLELSSLLLWQWRCFHHLIPVVDSSAKKITTNETPSKRSKKNGCWMDLQKSWVSQNFRPLSGVFFNTCIEVSISQFKKVTSALKNADLDFPQSLVFTTHRPCNLNF